MLIRYTGTVNVKFKKDAEKDDMFLNIAKELYKRGIIKINQEFNEEENDDIWSCTATVWWDKEENNTKTETSEEVEVKPEEKKGLFKKIFNL